MPPFYADLHIHSKFSRACSRDCDLEHLALVGRRKGISVIGTGDFTHPKWFEELESTLVPAEPGLFRLREDVERSVEARLPASCRGPVRFMLSVEISTIYKRAERTRKVHHLLYMPDLASAAKCTAALARIGNLASDGRPILGLDSRDLLEITLESGDGAYLVPAHVWTPWFAVLGSKSGFDRVEDCYADLAGHIFALETGLSADPEMCWRVSGLDRYRLVSNSDAHSPPALGREATVLDTELDYWAIRRALETGQGFEGTVEFFPEEGKYHLDGHRKCDVRMEPAETRGNGGLCPVCGKPPTVGVLHRVEDPGRPARGHPAPRGGRVPQHPPAPRAGRRGPRRRPPQQVGHRRGHRPGRPARPRAGHPRADPAWTRSPRPAHPWSPRPSTASAAAPSSATPATTASTAPSGSSPPTSSAAPRRPRCCSTPTRPRATPGALEPPQPTPASPTPGTPEPHPPDHGAPEREGSPRPDRVRALVHSPPPLLDEARA